MFWRFIGHVCVHRVLCFPCIAYVSFHVCVFHIMRAIFFHISMYVSYTYACIYMFFSVVNRAVFFSCLFVLFVCLARLRYIVSVQLVRTYIYMCVCIGLCIVHCIIHIRMRRKWSWSESNRIEHIYNLVAGMKFRILAIYYLGIRAIQIGCVNNTVQYSIVWDGCTWDATENKSINWKCEIKKKKANDTKRICSDLFVRIFERYGTDTKVKPIFPDILIEVLTSFAPSLRFLYASCLDLIEIVELFMLFLAKSIELYISMRFSSWTL